MACTNFPGIGNISRRIAASKWRLGLEMQSSQAFLEHSAPFRHEYCLHDIHLQCLWRDVELGEGFRVRSCNYLRGYSWSHAEDDNNSFYRSTQNRCLTWNFFIWPPKEICLKYINLFLVFLWNSNDTCPIWLYIESASKLLSNCYAVWKYEKFKIKTLFVVLSSFSSEWISILVSSSIVPKSGFSV